MAKNLIYLAAGTFLIAIIFKIGNIFLLDIVKASTFIKATYVLLLFSIALSLAEKK
ncbi:hypothetical protein ACFL5G_05460 [Candidatus Margulisiibacteriota bacterium]